MRSHDYETWRLIVQDVASDYSRGGEVMYSRQSMRIEDDDLENYDEINSDVIDEICDSLVPTYNGDLITIEYSGEEFWDLWLDNEYGGENPIDILNDTGYMLR